MLGRSRGCGRIVSGRVFRLRSKAEDARSVKVLLKRGYNRTARRRPGETDNGDGFHGA